MAPALGLPSLRSRTSLPRRRTTPDGGLVIFYKIKKADCFHNLPNPAFVTIFIKIKMASASAEAPADKPALGLPSLRSRTSLPRRRTTPDGGLVIFYKIKKADCFHNPANPAFVTIFIKIKMAPALGFEPRTKWLTATYSTAELCRSIVIFLNISPFFHLSIRLSEKSPFFSQISHNFSKFRET